MTKKVDEFQCVDAEPCKIVILLTQCHCNSVGKDRNVKQFKDNGFCRKNLAVFVCAKFFTFICVNEFKNKNIQPICACIM